MIDWTTVIVAVVGAAFPVLGAIATYLINKNMKDTAAAATLDAAVKNSLGAIQQAVETGITKSRSQGLVPGMSAETATGVQYVLDHAGTEAKRLGISEAAVADKVIARVGLAKIAAAESATTTTVKSPTPVAVTTTTTQGTPHEG